MQFDKSTPRDTITIQGLQFEAPSPYAEGHALSGREAGVLNQTLHENLRNNFARTVAEAKKKAKEETGDENNVDVKALQAEFNEYCKQYEFGVSRGGGFSGDPVRTEAMRAAREAVRNSIKKKGLTLREFTAKRITELAEAALEKHPRFLEDAKKVVAARSKAAATELDELEV